MAQKKRLSQYRVRLTDEEHQMLFAVAELMGVDASDVIRLHIRARYTELFPEEPRRRTKRR